MTTTVEPEHICWLDLETSGLSEAHDEILEVACVLTDFDLNEVDRVRHVVKPNHVSPWTMRDEVYEMHRASGLLDEIRKGEHINHVDFALTGWIRGACPLQIAALGGSGVAHFDRRFIKKYLPTFDTALTYWTLDIGVLRRTLTRLCGVEFDRLPIAHRAEDDVDQSISEAKRLIQIIERGTNPFAAYGFPT